MINFKVPKKYEKYFGRLEYEPDLIDDCNYMLYFADGYAYMGEFPSFPVKNRKEILECLKYAENEKYK